MAQLPSASAEPPAFQGPLQPHTGREPDLIDNPVGPGEYDTHIHTIGPQTLSQRPTLPAYSFGFGGPSLDVHKYPTKHLSEYPGPGKYGCGHSSVGIQYQSRSPNDASFSFGTGVRDPFSPLREASQTVPGAANTIKPHIDLGPASHDYGAGPESIGFQTLSHRPNLPSYTFGSVGTRAKKRNRFKLDRVVQYGDDSPGPCQYDGHKVIVAFGKSLLSGKKMAISAKFGTKAKFGGGSFKKPICPHRDKPPGPGKYIPMTSIGRQQESHRPNEPSTKFGTAPKDTHYFIDPEIPGPGKYGDVGKSKIFGKKVQSFGFGTTRKFRHHRVVMKDQVSPRQRRLVEAIKHTKLHD